MSPSDNPSASPVSGTSHPSMPPSDNPSASPVTGTSPPSDYPSASPSDNPSASPSGPPSMSPSTAPTVHQYLVSTSTTRGTWQEAQSWCQSQGTTLSSIHSTDEFNEAKARCKAMIDIKLN
eukprot:532323_1